MVHGIRETSNKARMDNSNPIQIRRCPQILVILTSEDMDYPFTSHGFTAGIKGRIGVPEFTIPRGLGVSIENGTEIWKITRDGKQTLYAVFKEGKFIVIK